MDCDRAEGEDVIVFDADSSQAGRPDFVSYGDRHSWPDRPSEEKFQALVEALDTSAYSLDRGERLAAVCHSVMATIAYFSNQKMSETGLLRPFHELHRALHELAQGGSPKLFEKPERATGATKPTNGYEGIPRAQLAALVDALIRCGFKKSEAGQWVVRECSKARVRMDTGRVNGWRDEIRQRRSAPLMLEAYDSFVTDFRLSESRQEVEQQGRFVIKAIALRGI